MPACCQSAHTCLSERSRAMRLTPPMGWDNKCLDCLEGTARQMDKWKPELDPLDTASPAAREKYSKMLKPDCPICGLPVKTYRAKMHRACMPVVVRPPKPPPAGPRTTCARGHSRARYGRKRIDGGYSCRLCTADRKREAYQRNKEARP